jgi:hypothetical protein
MEASRRVCPHWPVYILHQEHYQITPWSDTKFSPEDGTLFSHKLATAEASSSNLAYKGYHFVYNKYHFKQSSSSYFSTRWRPTLYLLNPSPGYITLCTVSSTSIIFIFIFYFLHILALSFPHLIFPYT